MVAEYLVRNPGCTFISSRQVVDQLRRSKSWNSELDGRVIEIDLEIGESFQVTGLEKGSIEATWVPHAHRFNRDVVNLAFRIEAEERSVVHTGDADSAEAKKFLSHSTADIALVGFWQWLTPEGKGTVEASAGVRRFGAVHVPPDASPYEDTFEKLSSVALLKDPGKVVSP